MGKMATWTWDADTELVNIWLVTGKGSTAMSDLMELGCKGVS